MRVLPAPMGRRLRRTIRRPLQTTTARFLNSCSKRQELNPIGNIFGFTRLGDDFQVAHAGCDRHAQLMRVDHPAEGDAFSQTCGSVAK